MDNEQLFDLTSHPSAEFDTAQKCLDTAKNAGYKKVYLETMPELIVAVPMYEKFGFTYLKGPLGNSGHNGCGIWMIKLL